MPKKFNLLKYKKLMKIKGREICKLPPLSYDLSLMADSTVIEKLVFQVFAEFAGSMLPKKLKADC